MKYKQNFYQM